MKLPWKMPRPKIMFFTDEPQLASGTAALLSRAAEFELIPGPASILELLPEVRISQPDVLLVDVTPDMTIGLFRLLREAAPSCRLVLWARAVAPEVLAQAKQAGIAGFVRRTSGDGEFLHALSEVVEGGTFFEERARERSTTIRLTRRESQIVSLLGQGLRNKEIASCLGLTEATVKSYLVSLFRKAGARDRFELALLGIKNSLCGQASWDGPGEFVTAPEEGRARPVLRSLVLVQPARRSGYPDRARRRGAGAAGNV
jgi:DNA-binding NarL/FixJ family response regulator